MSINNRFAQAEKQQNAAAARSEQKQTGSEVKKKNETKYDGVGKKKQKMV